MNGKHLFRRFFAFAIDWNILVGVAWMMMFFGPKSNPEYILYPSIKMISSPSFIIGLLWIPLYSLFKDCIFNKRSLGKLICNLKVINTTTGKNAAYSSLILRNITFLLPQIEGFIVLFNKGRRIGDHLANTKVVRCNK